MNTGSHSDLFKKNMRNKSHIFYCSALSLLLEFKLAKALAI